MPIPTKSPTKAIEAKCRDCIPHDPYSPGNWRDQIAACTVTSCPLYSFRPVPQNCQRGRFIDEVACSAVRERLSAKG